MPFMKAHTYHYQGPTIEDLLWEVRRLHHYVDEIVRREKDKPHYRPSVTPVDSNIRDKKRLGREERVIEVEEEKKAIWDEDPSEELQEPIWDEYPCEETPFHVEEVSWSPPEIESSKVIWDDVPCMIMPPEPSETRLQLLPCEISQPQELLAASEQPHQTVNVVTREVLQQLHSHDLSRDSFEVETIEMILPPDPVKSEVQLLLGHSSRMPLEYKFLPNIVIPKVDLAWVRVKSKKVSMSSASKLGPVQMLLHSFVDTPSRMMETPPQPGRMTGTVFVTVAVCYSNHRYCSKPLQ